MKLFIKKMESKLEVFTIQQDNNENINIIQKEQYQYQDQDHDPDQDQSIVHPFTMHGNMLSVNINKYDPQRFYNDICTGDVTSAISKEVYPKNFSQDCRANVQTIEVPSSDKRRQEYFEKERNKMRACKLYSVLFGFMMNDTKALDKMVSKIVDHVETYMTSLQIAIKEHIDQASRSNDLCSRLSLFLIAIVACKEIREVFLPKQEWHTNEEVKRFITLGDPMNIESWFNLNINNYYGPKVVQVDPYIVDKFFTIVKSKFFEYTCKQGNGKNGILQFVVECLIEYWKIFRITPFHIAANKLRHMKKII